MLEILPYIILLVVTLAAYILKGTTGFGPALIFIPAVSILYGPEFALTSSAIIDLIAGAVLFCSVSYTKTEVRSISKLLTAVVIGAGAGALIAGIVSTHFLGILIGIIVIGIGWKIRNNGTLSKPVELIDNKKLIPAGFFGGLSGGLTGMSGPFIVGAVSEARPKDFRRLLILIFLIEQPIKIAIYFVTGILVIDAVIFSLALLPIVGLGLFLGSKFQSNMNQEYFYMIVASILILMGIILIVTSL